MALSAAEGQLNPSATTATKLRTAAGVEVGHVVVANRDPVATSFRISKRIAGAAANDKQFINYDTPINGTDTYESPRIVLASTDEVWVYATLATLSFSWEGLAL